MDKLKMMSMDKVQANIEKIRALFPNAVTEVLRDGKPTLAVDFEVLKQELADTLIDDRELRYQFTWSDKQKAILRANEPTNKTLRPCREESVDFDSTQNLYIEGDNLEVLKLLQETYLGKIKIIYIDPPYNTGNDFVYNDDFVQDSNEYLESSGQFDEQGNRLFHNTESNGRFHTDWMNMIYPRLKLAKDLLSDDGVIFISIDEHEQSNLKKLCDEIYGSANHIGTISTINNLKGRSDDKFFATCNEFLLVYSKNSSALKLNGFSLDEEELENDYDLQDEISYYKLIGFRKTGNSWKREDRPNMFYPVLYKDNLFSTVTDEELNNIYNETSNRFNDDYLTQLNKKYVGLGYVFILPCDEKGNYGRWRWGINTFIEQKDYNLQLSKSGTLCTKMRATIADGSIRVKTAKTLWYKPEYDTGSSAKILKTLFNDVSIFDNPKSPIYIKDIIKISSSSNSVILDFFSGSATTAHAVMQLNAEDGGNRKFIMVQLPELCDEKSEAYKAGYKNICEIGKERIRRVGKKIMAESGLAAQNLDIGFRVFKLDSSNMQDVYYKPEEYSQTLLDNLQDNIKPDRTALDLLFQVMLELGKPLSAKITQKVIAGKNVINVDDGDLIACFEDNITAEIVTAIAKEKPLYAVFRDSGLSSDSVAANFEQIFATYSPNTKRKVL